MSSLTELKQHFPEAIALMPDRFDSHDLIDMVAQLHRAEYVAYVQRFDSHGRMGVGIAHRELSKALYDFPHLVQRDGDAVSINIRGHESKAAAWRKVK